MVRKANHTGFVKLTYCCQDEKMKYIDCILLIVKSVVR